MPIIINQNVYFDYLYIDDFCEIIEKIILNKPSERILNITPTEKIDLISIAEIINSISDHKSEIIINNDGLNHEYSGCNIKLLNEIGNLKFKLYNEAIKMLYDYYSSSLNSINIETIKNDKYLNFCRKS